MKAQYDPPRNYICGFNDRACTCASSCTCKSIGMCGATCCYRIPYGLGPSYFSPTMPTPGMSPVTSPLTSPLTSPTPTQQPVQGYSPYTPRGRSVAFATPEYNRPGATWPNAGAGHSEVSRCSCTVQ